MDVMKFEIVAYLQVVVDDIKAVDSKFPQDEVKSLQNLMENAYIGPSRIDEGKDPTRECKDLKDVPNTPDKIFRFRRTLFKH